MEGGGHVFLGAQMIAYSLQMHMVSRPAIPSFTVLCPKESVYQRYVYCRCQIREGSPP